MTPDIRAHKLELYGQAHAILTDALARFPREMWTFKPADGWSIHQIVVHITDSEANSFVRARRCIAEPGEPVMAYDENAWSTALRYEDQSTEDAVELFRWLRHNTYNLIKTLPESTCSNPIDHPEKGILTLDDWLDTYARHVPDHVEQMERCYEKWKAPNDE